MVTTDSAGTARFREQRRFDGRSVVVTGAAQGIGLGLAARFAHEGANVVMLDLSAAVEEAAEQVAARYPQGSALGVRADITSEEDVDRAFGLADRAGDGVDVLVNNAGVITISPVEELSLADWQRVLAVNTTGTFLCARAAAASMRGHGRGGRILNAASGQARQGFIYTPHYAASKFGVVGLTQSLAKELAKDRITVNAYSPGIVGSDMWDYNDRAWGRLLGGYEPGELMAEWVAGIPLGRAGTADDVAGLVLFLASEEAAYITGQTINVDGGMFMN
ncbi:SDR family oxidoreductase [Streptomyces zingiberis]|uniref:SDR family oxidoreductase n=1 Tax=Streptomyces zingiberis TaxID=2053010 RepID=A0ABX1C298_9ACTN|nr:SDR family oxidoreductase [Streptomyces zingiberis]NJQ02037.1 SDR family oxidoreductase [Streptomyces zingiberis]